MVMGTFSKVAVKLSTRAKFTAKTIHNWLTYKLDANSIIQLNVDKTR